MERMTIEDQIFVAKYGGFDKFILDHANMVWFLKAYVAKSVDSTILFQKEVEDAVAQSKLYGNTPARSKAASQANG
jgi:hypothetical protein